VSARIVRISIAPVKSLGLVHPDTVELQLGGVRGDRRFWLVDTNGYLINNKRSGPLMTIRADWDEASRALVLDLPDGRRVDGVVRLGDPEPVVLYGVPHPSRRVVGPWEDAIASVAGRPLKLLWSEEHATDRASIGGDVSFVSTGSLERLRVELGESEPVDGRRFRMLFELDGLEPHEEDSWIGSKVRVGSAEVLVNGDVGRCAVTTLDPDTGLRDLDTLGALGQYRPEGLTDPMPFGVYGAVTVPGRAAIGDVVAPI
jgi:uncharacterized protein YcbX